LAQTVRRKLGAEKFFALGDEIDTNSDAFSAKEKAVVNFVREYFEKRRVSDETFNELREYFDENQIIEIVAINACEHYFNALAIPLGIESDSLRQIAQRQV
jgi:alkylhydroperoxidase family enzyme